MVNKIIVVLLLLLAAYFVISLIITHTELTLNKTPSSMFKWLPDFAFKLRGIELKSLEPEQYTTIVGNMIFAIAFITAMVPLLAAWYNTNKIRKEIQEEYGIKSFPIKQPGEDDLEWMMPHYQRGQRITIFAGSFDWIGDKPEMRNRILQLANEGKLDLVSYRSIQEIEDAFRAKEDEELLNALRGRFKVKSKLEDITCTFVQKSATDAEFLYKSRPDDEGHAFNACVLSDTDKSRELLHILSKLTKGEHWGKRANEVGQSIEGSEGKG